MLRGGWPGLSEVALGNGGGPEQQVDGLEPVSGGNPVVDGQGCKRSSRLGFRFLSATLGVSAHPRLAPIDIRSCGMHADGTQGAQALLINGTVGVGKTTVAEAVGDLLADAGLPHAVLDLDWLRRSWPAPSGDRFNFEMLLRNLQSIAGNYLEAGATRLVLAGVVEHRNERKWLADAVGVGLTVCLGCGPSCRSSTNV